jgi:hypothetical protein
MLIDGGDAPAMSSSAYYAGGGGGGGGAGRIRINTGCGNPIPNILATAVISPAVETPCYSAGSLQWVLGALVSLAVIFDSEVVRAPDVAIESIERLLRMNRIDSFGPPYAISNRW